MLYSSYKNQKLVDLHQYQTYTAEDFILDEDFVKLSKGHSIEGVSLEQLKTELPEKNKEIDLALSIISQRCHSSF